MIWMIVCAVLASAGLLLIVWVLLGWCVLPPRREAVTIYRLSASEPQLERQVRAFVWSRKRTCGRASDSGWRRRAAGDCGAGKASGRAVCLRGIPPLRGMSGVITWNRNRK